MKKKQSIKKAVALKYDRTKDFAPRVKATGKGKTAWSIIEKAKEHNVPVESDPDLVNVLSKLELEEEIPPFIYKAVAELLAHIYSLNQKK